MIEQIITLPNGLTIDFDKISAIDSNIEKDGNRYFFSIYFFNPKKEIFIYSNNNLNVVNYYSKSFQALDNVNISDIIYNPEKYHKAQLNCLPYRKMFELEKDCLIELWKDYKKQVQHDR